MCWSSTNCLSSVLIYFPVTTSIGTLQFGHLQSISSRRSSRCVLRCFLLLPTDPENSFSPFDRMYSSSPLQSDQLFPRISHRRGTNGRISSRKLSPSSLVYLLLSFSLLDKLPFVDLDGELSS